MGSLFPVTCCPDISWGWGGVSCLQGHRASRVGPVRVAGSLRWVPSGCSVYLPQREVSDNAQKSTFPVAVQSMPCVLRKTLAWSKGGMHLPRLHSVARLQSNKIWVWITSFCWVRGCKMPFLCAVPTVLGSQINFLFSFHLSEFSFVYPLHYYQDL